MADSGGGVRINGLKSQSRWLHSFLIEVYSDVGLTNKVGELQPIAKWEETGLINLQHQMAELGGLVWGQTYYLRPAAVTPVTGKTVYGTTVAVVAGDSGASGPALVYPNTFSPIPGWFLTGYDNTDGTFDAEPISGYITANLPITQSAPAGEFFSSYDEDTGIFGTTPVSAYWPTLYEKFVMTWNGTIAADKCLLRHKVGPNPLTIPANLGNSSLIAEVAATGSSVFRVMRALAATPTSFSQVATFTFGVGGTVATLSTQAAISLAVGDIIKVLAPSSADATLADLGGALYCLR